MCVHSIGMVGEINRGARRPSLKHDLLRGNWKQL